MKGSPVEVQVRRVVETLRSATRPLPGLDAVAAVTPSNWYDLVSRLRLALHLGTPFYSIEAVQGWWDHKGSHECDLVGLNRARVPITVGSIRWRDRASFEARDLYKLIEARSVVPEAAAAGLEPSRRVERPQVLVST